MAKSTTKETPYWLWPVIFMGVCVVALATVIIIGQVNPESFDNSETTATPPTEDFSQINTENIDENDLTTVERHDDDDPLTVGDADAPVTMVVFSDYQCTFCATWSHNTLPVLLEDYVDTGDLRIEWRDVNIYGEPSENGAKAAYAAGMQDQFLEYQTFLYPDGDTLSEDELTEDNLIEVADTMGLDAEQFATDMDSATTLANIRKNEQLGSYLGAYATPLFILGGEPIAGAQPTDVFTQAVEEALNRADTEQGTDDTIESPADLVE